MQVELSSKINDTPFIHMSSVKVKFTLEQTMKAQWGRRGIALLFNLGARWGAGGQRHTPAALFLGEKPGAHFT